MNKHLRIPKYEHEEDARSYLRRGIKVGGSMETMS